MHEMAIAEGILDIALDYAQKNDAHRIGSVALRIGEMSGVETEALQIAWGSLIRGTMADGADLVIHSVPLMVRCQKCGHEAHLTKYDFFCPACKDGVMELLSGREMQVESLEVE